MKTKLILSRFPITAHKEDCEVPATRLSYSTMEFITGWARLIRSHSSGRFCFELSGNLN